MNFIKFIRIFLLVLIIIGIGLLITQKMWVPKVVEIILKNDSENQTISLVSGHQIKSISNSPSEPTSEINNYEMNVGYGEYICHESGKYFVVEGGFNEVGTDELVKYKTTENQKFNCKYVIEKGDFEIKNQSAEYFYKLVNNFLILDSGTGPDPRGLIIYNLDTRKKVYTDSYSQPVDIQNNTISYWTEISEKATKQNCLNFLDYEKNGLGFEAIETHIMLDLSTMTKRDLGEHRCSPRE